ncbi:MAG: hypothetical protein JWP37_1487 [Mucilaginibacter sp.]|nr:hypothetical protein [Mucilaginibacter sp.]
MSIFIGENLYFAMKPITLYLAITILIFCFSCNQNPRTNNAIKKPVVPKPLQDDKDVSFISKRRDNDLVQAIYSDLVKKHGDLQKLEDQMAHFNEGREDSLSVFKNYDSKSGDYYRITFEALDRVKDTVIRQRLRGLLTNSQKNYKSKVSKFTFLTQKIDTDQLSIADYYLTLKIVATLPVIEDYQDKSVPDTKSVEAIANESEKLKLKTQKLADKYADKQKAKK